MAVSTMTQTVGMEAQIVHAEPTGLASFSEEEVGIIKSTVCRDATDSELAFFLAVCKRTGLDPFQRQIYSIKRREKVPGTNNYRDVRSIQTGIDGYRVVALRSGQYQGQIGPLWCGADGKWVDVWLQDGQPAAAKLGVLRRGFTEPVWGVARWRSYVQDTRFWINAGPEQLAKCAEALALRKAFPNDLAGVLTNEEMGRADIADAEVLERRPKTPEQLKAALRAELEPRDVEPVVERIIPNEDPFAEEQSAGPESAEASATPDAGASSPLDPADPSAFRHRMRLKLMPAMGWEAWATERVWTKGMLSEWTPVQVILGSHNGKRHAALKSSIAYAKDKYGDDPPQGALYADYCLAFMEERWAREAQATK